MEQIRARVGSRPTCVSLDIDVLDPSFAGHAEITGVAASHAAFELIGAMAPRTASRDV